MMRTEVKDSHGRAKGHVGAEGKVGEANGETGEGLQLTGGRVFRGEAAKVLDSCSQPKQGTLIKKKQKAGCRKQIKNKTSHTFRQCSGIRV